MDNLQLALHLCWLNLFSSSRIQCQSILSFFLSLPHHLFKFHCTCVVLRNDVGPDFVPLSSVLLWLYYLCNHFASVKLFALPLCLVVSNMIALLPCVIISSVWLPCSCVYKKWMHVPLDCLSIAYTHFCYVVFCC